jgi:23S rRNA (pseudouridine1915-N3)-methyltransferase
MKITLLAIGKARGPEAEWGAEYIKRLKADITIKQLVAPSSLSATESQKHEAALLLKNIPAKSLAILLDERGKDYTSRAFAEQLQTWQNQDRHHLTFIIGGADGVTDDVKQRANITLSFGRTTWPHRLVRIMLLEQLYRAQQINAGHPYHRD